MESLQVLYDHTFSDFRNILTIYHLSGKAAPESFGNISGEVLSLQAVLKEAEETLFIHPLLPS